MIVNCYQINESLQLVPLHAEEAEGRVKMQARWSGSI